MSSPEKKGRYVDVDQLMPQISLQQVADYYGVPLPELRRVGAETRSRCFLNCGRTSETGDRVLAIQEGHPAKQWKCHQYECGKGGNLISLIDFIKPGANMDGRPRGERFKQIRDDLVAIAGGASRPEGAPSPAPTSSPAPAPEPPKVNVPLVKSENERARGLVDLDRKFVVDPAAMPPAAGSYFRRRPFLSSEVCRKWRCGYLPRDVGGEDRSGGTMRGRVVYPYLAEDGELLTWFGRDPEYEEKHAKWEAGGKTEREPIKTAFVKGFHKGIELFGQHVLRQEGVKDKLQGLGLVVVEGPNEVIRFDTLGLPVVGLCGNRISEEQAEKVARFAREVGGGTVTLMLDLDEEGRKGLLQCMEHLAQRVPVRVGWSSRMYGGKFKGRQPESLTAEEWTEIREYLIRGQVKV